MEKSNFFLKNNSDDDEENDAEFKKYMHMKIKKDAERDKMLAEKKIQKKAIEKMKSQGLNPNQIKKYDK